MLIGGVESLVPTLLESKLIVGLVPLPSWLVGASLLQACVVVVDVGIGSILGSRTHRALVTNSGPCGALALWLWLTHGSGFHTGSPMASLALGSSSSTVDCIGDWSID